MGYLFSKGKYLFVIMIISLMVILFLLFPEGLSGYSKSDSPPPTIRPKPTHVDHTPLFQKPFKDGISVTKACLECHQNAASEVMQTSHWTWESKAVSVPWKEKPIKTGKRYGINNYCISVNANWNKCSSCHAGYGWKGKEFNFNDQNRVDCLVCHDQSGQYSKGAEGIPRKGVDLLASARSVARPNIKNCGTCHFKGGGGNAVKHGDLDESLYHPTERLDVHMGRYGMTCVDCHSGEFHQIRGRSISLSVNKENGLTCTECHNAKPHDDQRLNSHTKALSCQSCHIPEVAIKTPTKTRWDWSEAGQDRKEDPHHYLKIKGSFEYAKKLKPEYYWYNGNSKIYIKGDPVNRDGVTKINEPFGSIKDGTAKIYPFKVHRGKQIFDKKHGYLIPPKTTGKGGYWSEFDWNKAARLGAEQAELDYSGEYDFAETEMYWQLDHMVAPASKSLQCQECHKKEGRLDWKALGYPGDPIDLRFSREVK